MEREDWLRRGILVSNLPTSDEVTTDKLEIHFSKRSNGGGDVDDIVMLDNFMAIVKFKEERTVNSVLAKRSQYLLDSILTVTRYTKSDMEFLKASSITCSPTNQQINCNGYDGLSGSDTADTDDDTEDKCSCDEYMQDFVGFSSVRVIDRTHPILHFEIFTNMSACIPFSKLEPGLLASGKRNTLNRISVNTGARWYVDDKNNKLILSGTFEEVRQAAKKLQHYSISEDVVVDKPDSMSPTFEASRISSRQRSPRPSPQESEISSKQRSPPESGLSSSQRSPTRLPPESKVSSRQKSPRPSPSESRIQPRQRSPRASPPESPERKIQKTEIKLVEQSKERNQLQMNPHRERITYDSKDRYLTEQQNSRRTLKLRPMSQDVRKKVPPIQRTSTPSRDESDNSDDDFPHSRTNGRMKARGVGLCGNQVNSSTIQDVKESDFVETVQQAKPRNTAKVDISALDPKLLRYLFTVRKSNIERIERLCDVKFVTTEKGQVSVEVNKDVSKWESNLRSSIADFQMLLGKVREQDPDVKTFGLGDLGLSSNDFEDIYHRVCNENPEIIAEILEEHTCIQVYGTSSAIEKAEDWFEQEVFALYQTQPNKEEEFEDDLECDNEDDVETGNESGEDEEEKQEEEDYEESEDDTIVVRNGVSQMTLDGDTYEQCNGDWGCSLKSTGENLANHQFIKPTRYLNTPKEFMKKGTSLADSPKEREHIRQGSFSAVNLAKDKTDVVAEAIFAQIPNHSGRKQQSSDDLSSVPQPPATLKRVVEQKFDQSVLNYIQNFHFEDINGVRNKYGVEFEMRDNGVVQVCQRNSSNYSDLKLKTAVGELKALVKDVQGNIHTETLDIRKFPDANIKIINLAIRIAKENKKVLVEDGPGCNIKVHGTQANVKVAVDGFLKIIKTGKVDDKPKSGEKQVGKQQPKAPFTNPNLPNVPTPKQNRFSPSFTHTRTSGESAAADEFAFQAARLTNDESGDYDKTWQKKDKFSTLQRSVNPHVFESIQSDTDVIDSIPIGQFTNHDNDRFTSTNALLADPRNYLELNEEAHDLISAPSNTNPRDEQDDEFNDHMHWYGGDLPTVLTNCNTQQAASTKPNKPDTVGYFSTVTGAVGGVDYDDDSEDNDSPDGGLIDDIANFGDLDDEVPAPVSFSLPTSAGFDIEIQSGDITLEFVSVIVTSADPNLSPNTGASRAIQKAGGVDLVKECQNWVDLRGTVDASKPVYTVGGNLTCSQVLHVVPPDQGSQAAIFGTNPLIDMMKSVMKICTHPLKATSIVMPAIGIDALQMKDRTYATYLFEAVLDCIKHLTRKGTTIRKLRIVDKNPSLIETLKTIFTRLSNDPNNTRFFQPGAPPAFHVQPTDLLAARNSGAKPKRNDRRRNRSFSNRSRTSNSNNFDRMFQSERLTSRTTATTYDDDDDEDLASPFPFTTSSVSNNDTDEAADKCPVCLDTIKQPKTLNCKHTFCRKCLDASAKHQGQLCPVCKQPFGKGRRARTMPPGSMDVTYDKSSRIPGYPDATGVIVINYIFTSGIQNRFHPNPGSIYQGTSRTAYLPDNPEGQDVLNLLKRAFDSKLTFTIGTSSSTGAQDVIVWNDIHHKTSKSGGSQNHGYPDPQYLARVRKELEDKGIR